ncbi:hypothetical protein [Flavobacterium orientale]|uniref:Uncharacterized protein n=1 Tax=Flavobacterium orientale TaxID=1756020 RepID=A0A916Y8M8_9FLAO|nr:hypothetical protein [Flavobacterium orientale]GGD34307.1 hypothetical protein GCM10011343_25250 [Flavobacterium orientale]
MKVTYLNNTLSDENRVKFDEGPNPFSICLIFENSMIGEKILLENFTSKEIFFNDTLMSSTTNLNISKIVYAQNTHGLDLFIDNKLYFVEGNTYLYYRFLVIKKIKEGKYSLTYTNQVRYW